MLYVGFNSEGVIHKITNEPDNSLQYLEISAEMYSKFAESIENIDDYTVVKKDDYVLDEEADDYISKFISDTLETTSDANDNNSSEDEVSAIIETKRMIQQQQQQIDLLMNLVKQQNQQQSPQQASYDDIVKKEESPDKKSQIQQNVAPLKANLFVDGTWLYYSLNTRNPDRCPIIKKFGKGWQNNYKVDW